VLIHGNGGASLEGIWFPYVYKELCALGLAVVAINFPDPIKGRARFWIPFLRDVIRPDENTVVVGHSSGGLVAMRYAEKMPLLGTFLIAAHYEDCGFELEKRSGFFDLPFDWTAIRKNQEFIVQFHSNDDPWIPQEHAIKLHDYLQTELFILPNEGHFGSSGRDKKYFPELVDAIRTTLLKYFPTIFDESQTKQ
jgi:uncharacterized protein